MSKLKVLFVAADPYSADPQAPAPRLRIDDELREIGQRVLASRYRDSVEFVPCLAARPLDLIEALNRHRPDAVHFSGHGGPGGAFTFTGDDGEARPVSPALLAEVFAKVPGRVRLVVLNACSTRPVAQSVARVIDCAVGMTQPITDDDAITFSAMFYGAMGFALSVREAFDQGILGIGLEAGSSGAHVPRLYARAGIDPSRVVLVSGGPQTPCDAALAVLRDELQQNLSSLAWQITHTLTRVPSGTPVPQRPGEPRASFDDRDGRWFADDVRNVFDGYSQFALRTAGYAAHRLNLAECGEVRRQSGERAYGALDEVSNRLAMYRLRLNGLVGGRRTPEWRARWAGLYARQAANALAILWCHVLEGWAMLEPEDLQMTIAGSTLVPRVLRGITVAQTLAAGEQGRAFATAASAAMYGEKAALINEEIRLQQEESNTTALHAASPGRAATPLEAIAHAGVAWAEGRAADTLACFEEALSFSDVPPDQRSYAEASLEYLRHPDRFDGVLGTYLLDVEPGGTAAQAGLQPGDVIVRYNASPVTEPYVLSRLVSQARGAPLVQAEVIRGSVRFVSFLKGGASLSARGTALVFGDSFAL